MFLCLVIKKHSKIWFSKKSEASKNLKNQENLKILSGGLSSLKNLGVKDIEG